MWLLPVDCVVWENDACIVWPWPRLLDATIQLDETVLRFITMLTPKEAGELPAVLRDEMSSWWSNNGRKFEGNASWMEAKQVLLAVEAQQNKK